MSIYLVLTNQWEPQLLRLPVDSYDDYAERARIMTQIHALRKGSGSSKSAEAESLSSARPMAGSGMGLG